LDAIGLLELVPWERGHPGRLLSRRDACAPRKNHTRIFVQVRTTALEQGPCHRSGRDAGALLTERSSGRVAPPLSTGHSSSQAGHDDTLSGLLTFCRNRNASPPRLLRASSRVDQEVTERAVLVHAPAGRCQQRVQTGERSTSWPRTVSCNATWSALSGKRWTVQVPRRRPSCAATASVRDVLAGLATIVMSIGVLTLREGRAVHRATDLTCQAQGQAVCQGHELLCGSRHVV
jgi:hypothetical protein